MNYIVRRISACYRGSVYFEIVCGDINTALTTCENFNNYYCAVSCGCRF